LKPPTTAFDTTPPIEYRTGASALDGEPDVTKTSNRPLYVGVDPGIDGHLRPRWGGTVSESPTRDREPCSSLRLRRTAISAAEPIRIP